MSGLADPHDGYMQTKLMQAAVAMCALSLLFIGFPSVAAPAVNASELNSPTWVAVSHPDPNSAPGLLSNGLLADSCVGGSFCMAVGLTAGDAATTLTEMWNGADWTVVPSPDPADATDSSLSGISCTSPTFCMAVGSSGTQSETNAFAEEWDGARWSVLAVNGQVDGVTVLTGVSCASQSMCAAVGWDKPANGGTDGTVTESAYIAQWGGTSWAMNYVEDPTAVSSLSGVSCWSATSCMAVGNSTTSNGDERTLAEQDSNGAWRIDPSPNVLGFPTGLAAVSCIGSSYCIAVGSWQGATLSNTLVESWNGQAWTVADSPNQNQGDAANDLTGVSCTGPEFCTAVGGWEPENTATNLPNSLIESWGGSAWSIDNVPNEVGLSGVSCSGPLVCTAVGNGVFSKSTVIETTSGQVEVAPVVGIALDGATGGYRLAGADGGVAAFDASYLGSVGGNKLNEPIVGMASTPNGQGYWLVAADGGIFSWNAPFVGSLGGLRLNKPIVGITPTPDGGGYWLVASDGGVFTFGDATFYGSTGASHLNRPIVGMASTPDGRGYWLVASDGGIFAFGDAAFYGSTGAMHLNKPIVGMAAAPNGQGYWLTASDGGIFAFGDATFYGSTGALRLNKPIVGMASTADGQGYWLAAADGGIFSFGDASFQGAW